MKTFALFALIAAAGAVHLNQEWVDKDGKFHPFYFGDDEDVYEQRYKAASRQSVKKDEKEDVYKNHPTDPVGYIWDTNDFGGYKYGNKKMIKKDKKKEEKAGAKNEDKKADAKKEEKKADAKKEEKKAAKKEEKKEANK